MTDKLPTTRKEAIKTGSKHYYTGKPCVHGHIDIRNTKQRRCIQCAKDHSKKYTDEVRGTTKEQRRLMNREWDRNNPDKRAMHNANRRAKKKAALPSYAELDKPLIADIYKLSQRITELTGEAHVVDHLIPVNPHEGELEGLHASINLRIITRSENCKKSNNQHQLGGQSYKFIVRKIGNTLHMPFKTDQPIGEES